VRRSALCLEEIAIGPEVLEIKRKLDGSERVYSCTLVRTEARWAVLQYVLPIAVSVGTLQLPEGAITIAHYWTDREYTAYHWLTPEGRTLGVYLNAASRIEITPGVVRWQDLELDVLVLPHGCVEVLDEQEAQRAPRWAVPALERARGRLLPRAVEIAGEVETLTHSVWTAGPLKQRTSP
jgi:hypothetical protein